MTIAFKLGLIITLFLTYLYFPVQVWAKTFYLDGNLSADCSGSTYSVANRNCSGSDGQGYKTLQTAINNLLGSDTLYIRSGTYIRTTNDYWRASLHIGVSGTPTQRTVVRAYPTEQPIICTEVGRCQYNPNPGDTSVNVCTGAGGQGGAACYYPNPAIWIGGNYIDVIGLKTYGQVVIHSATNSTLQDSDIGGGGPYINQGQAVGIYSSHTVTIRDNLIHHSVWGESHGNGSALMSYNSSYIVENNEFYDNWSSDIKVKASGGQGGRRIIIRNNFFRPSTVFPSSGGVTQHSSNAQVDYIDIHNNIFYQKKIAIGWESPAVIATTAYNNTFVNCESDIFEWLSSPPINIFNNLHYHSVPSQRFIYLEGDYDLASLSSDYNNFYTTADARWRRSGASWSSLSAWRSGSGKDANSIASNPNFLNAAGNRPEHFKRTSYPNELSGSKYGTVTGAYSTGNEVIGVSLVSPPVTPPDAPTTLTVSH